MKEFSLSDMIVSDCSVPSFISFVSSLPDDVYLSVMLDKDFHFLYMSDKPRSLRPSYMYYSVDFIDRYVDFLASSPSDLSASFGVFSWRVPVSALRDYCFTL